MDVVWLNRSWAIQPPHGGGWMLRELWKPPEEAFATDVEWRTQFVSEHERRLLWFAPDLMAGVPPAERLQEASVIVVRGDSRLITVTFGTKGSVSLVPFALSAEESEQPRPDDWPFCDRSRFAGRLRELGRAFAESSDDEVLGMFAKVAQGLGLRWVPPRSEPLNRVELGQDVVVEAGSPDCWRVRRGDEATAETVVMPTDQPRVAVLLADGRAAQPSGDIPADSMLVASLGNGRLVAIELEPDGLVSILPQEFR